MKAPTPRRFWPIVRRLAMALIVFSLLLPAGLCVSFTRFGRQPVVPPRHPFPVAVQEIHITASDETLISGWYAPGQTGKTAFIFCHGVGANRLQMLDPARFLVELGHPALLFDFRHHGESGGGFTSYGHYEKLDVLAMVGELHRLTPGSPIVLWGLSMGAATALLAAAESPQVAGVIAESPFDSLPATFAHHSRLFFNLPYYPLGWLTLHYIGWGYGFDPGSVSPIDAVRRLSRTAILFVSGKDDPRMPPDLVRTIAATHQGPHWIFEGEGDHAMVFDKSTVAYQEAVRRFLAHLEDSARP
ncbi:MAG: alpha/beta hydrolase [Myxococcales bacterium]|nr:MAG: alpha/beta hydrolase [Myxococcales bacterium]